MQNLPDNNLISSTKKYNNFGAKRMIIVRCLCCSMLDRIFVLMCTQYYFLWLGNNTI